MYKKECSAKKSAKCLTSQKKCKFKLAPKGKFDMSAVSNNFVRKP